MKITKLIACALIAATALCAISCGKEAQTTESNSPDTPDTAATTAASSGETEAPSLEDLGLGEPTDSFELPAESEGIVGIWKLGGADGAALVGMEIWEFKADGTFNMICTDVDGIQSGSVIPGQYRIKGNNLNVTLMGATIKYTFKLEGGNVILNDHDSDTVLEPFTGNITYVD